MKNWMFSINSGFLGKRRNRFTQYQPDRTLEEKFEMASQINGIEGIELKYPADLKNVALVAELLNKTGLKCSAVNVDIKDAEHFRFGALSARSAEARNKAISLLREGMDMAADLGVNLVSTCPLADGYDYPFQIDYTTAWRYFVESVKEVVSHRNDVKLALEFQPHEPNAKIMLGNVGKVLHVCAEVGAPNLGANLDIGHSFAATESPAESAAMLASKGRLFYIHTNDNTGDGGDWDMISGSIHFWHWLELIYTLDQIGYDGWLGGDIESKHMSPKSAYETNIYVIQQMINFIDKIGTNKITELIEEDGNTPKVYKFLSKHLLSYS